MIGAMRNRYAPHIDFGFLKGVISENPNFMPSNIDMVLERKGSFLFGEWKKDGEEISVGQKILLKQLAHKHRVLLVTGDDSPNILLIQEIVPTGFLKPVGKSVEDLKQYIQEWYKNAEENYV
jgi:hypothetical protein